MLDLGQAQTGETPQLTHRSKKRRSVKVRCLPPKSFPSQEEVAVTDLIPPDHKGPRSRGRAPRQSR